MLPPGPGMSRRAVARSQRERLFGATVAAVDEHGYEATRVADIIDLAGVSRSGFYALFANKAHCFGATLAELLDLGRRRVVDAYQGGGPDGEQRLRAAFAATVDLIVAQPAAARLCAIEAYAAGAGAVARVEGAADDFVRLAGAALRDSPEREALPPDLARAIFGGIRAVIQDRLRTGREGELPALVDDLLGWALAYRPPPGPLRGGPPPPPPDPTPPGEGAEDDQRRRLLDAVEWLVADRGVAELTIADVADEARVSLSTFYACFSGRAEAIEAALADADARLAAAAEPACAAADDWPGSVVAGLRAGFALLARRPATAWTLGVEALAAGGPGLAARGRTQARVARAVERGPAPERGSPSIAAEAIGGAIATLLYERLQTDGDRDLGELAPRAAYLALAPALGPERARAAADAD